MKKFLLGLVITIMMAANVYAINEKEHSFDEFISFWDNPSQNLSHV